MPKTLYLDTEFNGFGGDLISMGLYDPSGDGNWYEVAAVPDVPHPWVAANVIPVLGKGPISLPNFGRSLRDYLLDRDGCEIVADWPEDFIHLLRLMVWPDGKSLAVRLTLTLVQSPQCYPAIPHNALSDAEALYDALEVG